MTFKIDFYPNLSSLPQKELQKQLEIFKSTVQNSDYGFFSVVDKDDLLQSCEKLYKKFSHRKSFIHVGIGGSSLGTKMLVNALAKKDKMFTFIDNIDPDMIFLQLENLDHRDALFYIVSKSGRTAETMAALIIITNWLKKQGVETCDYKDYLICATDPCSSDLFNLAHQLKINHLPLPSNIGGRFSVLTAVGLFPALFADINAEALLEGAREIKKTLLRNEDNPMLKTAFFIMELTKKGIDQTVFMPYSSRLKELSSWIVQLWAESLGKDNKGLTPLSAYGATDQHSQMQLFMEGPVNKCLFLLEIGRFHRDYPLKNPWDGQILQILSPHTLGELMHAEFHGTCKALREKNRPFIHLTLPQIDEKTLGGLILFFESLTVLIGDSLQVNPFNQPGVEAAKQYTLSYLEKMDSLSD